MAWDFDRPRVWKANRNAKCSPALDRIESVNQTLKGQLDLEQHSGRTPHKVYIRVAQRLLAMTTAIWHN
jgi:hypothetical protein